MGGIISTFVGISIDAIVGCSVGVLSEYVFSRSGTIANPWMAGFEALIQLTTEALIAGEVSSLISPSSYSRPYGVVFMMYFALMTSHNMRQKMAFITNAMQQILNLPSGGLYSKIAELETASS